MVILAAIVTVCIVLSEVSIFLYFRYEEIVASKDKEISDLRGSVASKNIQILRDRDEIKTQKNIIDAQAADLDASANDLKMAQEEFRAITRDLEDTINADNWFSPELKTLVFDVCWKGEGYTFGLCSDFSRVYDYLDSLTDYEVIITPEFEGNLNFAEMLDFFVANVSDVPIALPAFGGGLTSAPELNLSAAQVAQAFLVLPNMKMVMFDELISWHLANNRTIPIDNIRSILAFCRSNNLRVMWSEWQVGEEVFLPLRECIAGYEDIVTVLFQTNNKDVEPLEGYAAVRDFDHWGASDQSWWWRERGFGDEADMPISLFVQHAVTAKNMGAEIIQFEPYWYLYDDDAPKELLGVLAAMVF